MPLSFQDAINILQHSVNDEFVKYCNDYSLIAAGYSDSQSFQSNHS
jgi:hypothetical protein